MLCRRSAALLHGNVVCVVAVPNGRNADLALELTDGLYANERYESAFASHDTHVLREKLDEGPDLFTHQHPLQGDLERR